MRTQSLDALSDALDQTTRDLQLSGRRHDAANLESAFMTAQEHGDNTALMELAAPYPELHRAVKASLAS